MSEEKKDAPIAKAWVEGIEVNAWKNTSKAGKEYVSIAKPQSQREVEGEKYPVKSDVIFANKLGATIRAYQDLKKKLDALNIVTDKKK